MAACTHCSRKYNMQALERHERVCAKTYRPPVPGAKARAHARASNSAAESTAQGPDSAEPEPAAPAQRPVHPTSSSAAARKAPAAEAHGPRHDREVCINVRALPCMHDV